jgi:Pyruvate/2-oxoacid:ferredoxin oxidoreductase gamma subunit
MRDLKQLPGLLKQERAASTVSLKILFLVELNSKNFDVANEKLAQCRSSLRDVCNELVDNYIAKETKLGTVAVQIRDTLIDEIEREINGLVPLVNTVIIAGFSRMTESEFFHNREWIFDLLCKLVKVNNAAIRASVAAIMQQRIRAVLVEMKN